MFQLRRFVGVCILSGFSVIILLECLPSVHHISSLSLSGSSKASLGHTNGTLQRVKEALVDDITLVTAYFNIGNFQKGRQSHVVGTDSYLRWMEVYGRIKNPVVAFFDDEDILNYFKNLRGKFETEAFLLMRDDLWSFRIRDRIKTIFETPDYPKHLPNTVIPEYSCAMHAKYEILQMAAEKNYFGTKYIGWLDIGLFRFDTQNNTFGLWLPPNFDPSKVSYAEAHNIKKWLDLREIIIRNSFWVSGAMNLGTIGVVKNFTTDYLKFVKYSLEKGLISTDQQVIYGMYTDNVPESVKPSVLLQTYSEGPGNRFFRLGYICRQSWMEREKY